MSRAADDVWLSGLNLLQSGQRLLTLTVDAGFYWNIVMVKSRPDTPADLDAGSPNADAAALPQDFETALAKLEALVAKMESGDLPLEESLAAYEQGVELAKICQRRLDRAEQQVKVLQDNLLRPLQTDLDEADQ